jgi:hypothetical protein
MLYYNALYLLLSAAELGQHAELVSWTNRNCQPHLHHTPVPAVHAVQAVPCPHAGFLLVQHDRRQWRAFPKCGWQLCFKPLPQPGNLSHMGPNSLHLNLNIPYTAISIGAWCLDQTQHGRTYTCQ